MPTLFAPLERPVDDATRRKFLGILAAAGLLTACGTSPGTRVPDGTAATRTVIDDDGREVEFPADPQRVVFLDEENAAHVTTLGYVPHGIAWNYQPDFATLLAEFGGDTGDLSGVGDAGPGAELNFEKILALRPDLIIGWTGRDDTELGRLTGIAPYVAVDPRTDRGGVEFAQVRFRADLVGHSEQAESRISTYQQALMTFRERYAEELRGLDYTYLDVSAGQASTYNLPGYAVNAVMAGLGVPMSDAMREATAQALGYPDDPDSGYATFSLELASGYDAGVVFVGQGVDVPNVESLPGDVRAALTSTHALAQDQVFPVVTNVWTFHLLESNLAVLGELDSLFAAQDVVART